MRARGGPDTGKQVVVALKNSYWIEILYTQDPSDGVSLHSSDKNEELQGITM